MIFEKKKECNIIETRIHMGIMKKSKKKELLSLNTFNVINVASKKKPTMIPYWYIFIANRPLVIIY